MEDSGAAEAIFDVHGKGSVGAGDALDALYRRTSSL